MCTCGMVQQFSHESAVVPSVQGVVAEQNTRLAGPMFDVVCRYEEDLGEEMTSMLFCALLEMLLSGELFPWDPASSGCCMSSRTCHM